METSQDLRIIKTHIALCQAFLELINEKSFDSITVSELCEKAMVRRATFYKHFSDKNDFFKFFVLEMHKKLEEKCLEEIKDPSSYEYLITMIDKLICFVDVNKKMFNYIFENNLLPTVMDILSERIIINFKKILCSSPNMTKDTIEIMASFYIGGIMRIIYWWLSNKNNISKDEMIAICRKRIETIKYANTLLNDSDHPLI